MTGQEVAIVVTAAIAAGALVVAVLAARRYRELHEALTTAGILGRPRPAPARHAATVDWLPAVGSSVPDAVFAVTTDGEVLTPADFAGPDVAVVFLASSCPPCRAALPDVRAALGRRRDGSTGRPRSVAVLGGPPEECAEYAAALSGLARIVHDGDAKSGGLSGTLGVRGNPAVLVLGGGVVRAAGMTVGEVLSPAAPPVP